MARVIVEQHCEAPKDILSEAGVKQLEAAAKCETVAEVVKSLRLWLDGNISIEDLMHRLYCLCAYAPEKVFDAMLDAVPEKKPEKKKAPAEPAPDHDYYQKVLQ